jgi:hypothetical protein
MALSWLCIHAFSKFELLSLQQQETRIEYPYLGTKDIRFRPN